jgi:hypothetical protein
MDTPLAHVVPVSPGEPDSLAPLAPPVRVLELAVLFVVCALADVCLYGGTGGAGQAALLVAVPAILLLAARRRRGSLRFVAVGALLLAVATRVLWQPSALGLATGLSGIVAFAVALRVKRSYLPELLVSAAASFVASFGSLGRLAKGSWMLARPRRLLQEHRWVSVVAPVGAVAIFTMLFSAANPVVAEWLSAVWALLAAPPHDVTALRASLWIATALGTALLLYPVVREPKWNERLGPGHVLAVSDAVPGATARATARNILVAVNLLFLVYNVLDATYLWAGRLPAGIGYTTYAHRGAAWLTLSLVVSTIGLGILFRGAMSFAAETRGTRILGYVWALQNLVLAAGTLRRITLYVDFSGLTRLLIPPASLSSSSSWRAGGPGCGSSGASSTRSRSRSSSSR